MAGFCGNCGFKLNDGDRVCGNCGTPVAGIPVGAPADNPGPAAGPGPIPAPMSGNVKSQNKTILLIIGVVAAVVVLLAALVVFNFISQNTGYKGTVKKMVKALENEDMDELEELASSISEDIYGSSYYGLDYYEELVDRTLDKYEDAVGNIKDIGYTIENVKEISERRQKNIKRNLEDSYNIDTDDIDEIRALDLRITVKGADGSANFRPDDLYLIKEDGSWKIYYGYLSYN